jgi:hypothetical protein
MTATEAEFRPTAADTKALEDDIANAQGVEDVQLALLDEKMFRAASRLAKSGLLKPTSLDLAALDEALPYATYEQIGKFLGAMNRSCAWWIGDWLVYGEGVYKEKFAQAASETGLAEQTLLNRAYVCRHVPPERRIEGLAFGVHALVAALSGREQKKWLAEAKKNGWGREDLRRAMRDTHATDRDEAPLAAGDHEPLEPGVILEAALAVVKSRKDYGADWLVPKDRMARLIAAVGEEE